MSVLFLEIRVGAGVLHGHVLRLACGVAAHDGLRSRLGLGVEADSIFEVAWVVDMIEVFLVDVATVGLLEGALGTVGAVTRGLTWGNGLGVVLPGRVCVSDSVVHLLEAVEHRFVAGLGGLGFLGNRLGFICGKLTVKIH